MATRKTSPPKEEKPQKPTAKTKPAAEKTSSGAATARKTSVKKKAATEEQVSEKKIPARETATKNDNPKADESKKPLRRKPSPRNGNVLPEGRPFKPGEQARENGRKGGIKSAQVKAARKTLREELLELLQVTTRDSDGKIRTRQEKISLAMIMKAERGDVRAYESIKDTIGEKQAERISVAVTVPKFENLDAAFADMSGDAP